VDATATTARDIPTKTPTGRNAKGKLPPPNHTMHASIVPYATPPTAPQAEPTRRIDETLDLRRDCRRVRTAIVAPIVNPPGEARISPAAKLQTNIIIGGKSRRSLPRLTPSAAAPARQTAVTGIARRAAKQPTTTAEARGGSGRGLVNGMEAPWPHNARHNLRAETGTRLARHLSRCCGPVDLQGA